MRVLFSGGMASHSVLDSLNKQLNTNGDVVFAEKYIEDISNIFNMGNYFDKAVITEQSITHDYNDSNESNIRQRINKFSDLSAERNRNETYIFLTRSEELAEIISEETFRIQDKTVIICKQTTDKGYSSKFLAKLIKIEISQLPDELIFKPKFIGEDIEEIEETDDFNFDVEDIKLSGADTWGKDSKFVPDDGFIPTSDIDIDFDSEFDIVNEKITEDFSKDVNIDIETEGTEEPDFDSNGFDIVEEVEQELDFNSNGFNIIEEPDFEIIEENNNSNIDLNYNFDRLYEDESSNNNIEDNKTVGLDESIYETEISQHVEIEQYNNEPQTKNRVKISQNKFNKEPLPKQNTDANIGKQKKKKLFGKKKNEAINNVQNKQVQNNQIPYIPIPNQVQMNNNGLIDTPVNNSISNDNLYDNKNNSVVTAEDFYKQAEVQTGQIGPGLGYVQGIMNNQSGNMSPDTLDENIYNEAYNRKNAAVSYGNQYNDSNVNISNNRNQYNNNMRNNGISDDKLRNALMPFAARGNNILVTGCGGCGTSTIAFNIANSIANLGFTVLLVDFDTEFKAQSYISLDSYRSMEPNDANLMGAVNSSGSLMNQITIVKKGLHLLTMGMANDFVNPKDVFSRDKIARFINLAKPTHQFIVYDVPFKEATNFLSEIAFMADNILLVTEANTHGLTKTMLSMCNIDSTEVQETFFSKSEILYNKYRGLNKLLGYRIKQVSDIPVALDNKVRELVGGDIELYFSDIFTAGIINDDPDFEIGWYNSTQYSDVPKGKAIFNNLIYKLLLKR